MSIAPITVPLMENRPPTSEVPIGSPLLFEDADYAGPALAINLGSADDVLGLELDTPIRLEPA